MSRRCAIVALLVGLASVAASIVAVPARAAGDTPQARRATQALNILEAQGFAAGLQDRSFEAFNDFQEQGRDFVATIRQNGRTFVVLVNPETGQVTRRD